MADRLFGAYYFSAAYGAFSLGALLSCGDFRDFSDRVLARSVTFLRFFDRWSTERSLGLLFGFAEREIHTNHKAFLRERAQRGSDADPYGPPIP